MTANVNNQLLVSAAVRLGDSHQAAWRRIDIELDDLEDAIVKSDSSPYRSPCNMPSESVGYPTYTEILSTECS